MIAHLSLTRDTINLLSGKLRRKLVNRQFYRKRYSKNGTRSSKLRPSISQRAEKELLRKTWGGPWWKLCIFQERLKNRSNCLRPKALLIDYYYTCFSITIHRLNTHKISFGIWVLKIRCWAPSLHRYCRSSRGSLSKSSKEFDPTD